MSSYTIGQLVHLTATFKVGATLTNPTTVTLTIKAPDGTITTPTAVNDSTGQYHYDVTASMAGPWWYTFAGTGACQAANQNSFDVQGAHTS